MVLLGLDGSFSCVGGVDVWRDELEIDNVLLECFLELGGAFVVKDVCLGRVSIDL
jgi:hypothetical protein